MIKLILLCFILFVCNDIKLDIEYTKYNNIWFNVIWFKTKDKFFWNSSIFVKPAVDESYLFKKPGDVNIINAPIKQPIKANKAGLFNFFWKTKS